MVDIKAVAHEGAQMGLLNACNDRLWKAKGAIEEAWNPKGKGFKKCIADARKLIDDAETLWGAYHAGK